MRWAATAVATVRRRVRRWTTAPDSSSSRSLGEPCLAPAPGPIVRVGISVGESSGALLVLRRYVGAKAAVKENPGSAGGRNNQNVRMVGTGAGSSGHSRGSRGYSDHPEMPVPLSAPGPTRTGDPQVRSLTLYPARLEPAPASPAPERVARVPPAHRPGSARPHALGGASWPTRRTRRFREPPPTGGPSA